LIVDVHIHLFVNDKGSMWIVDINLTWKN